MKSLGDLYLKSYELICGRPPHLRLWHFQWLATKDLYADLRAILPDLEGRILDVGCGDKPYEGWLNLKKAECVGLDTYAGPGIDLVIRPSEAWPLPASSFDVIVCTQVLEHVADLNEMLKEMARALKRGGLLLVTVPFIYNLHTQGAIKDYRRFSHYGVNSLFAGDFEIVEIKLEGGIGSTLGTLLLNWIDMNLSYSATARILKGLLLPLWILLCAAINVSGWLLDKLDRTQAFYSNVLLVAKKREPIGE